MASINARGGNLFFDFRFRGVRCREYTKLEDTVANRKRMEALLQKMEAEMLLGSFEYDRYFPGSKFAGRFRTLPTAPDGAPLFKDFAETWYAECKPEWRHSHLTTRRQILDQRLIPTFGHQYLTQITKAEILAFRAKLSSEKNRYKKPLAPQTINHIMTPLRMIMTEASERYGFRNPYTGIKSLRIPRRDIQPFSLDEVRLILDTVRPDFKNYYTVRFYTGMRTGEIDGLRWRYVDFERREILVRETYSNGRTEDTKTEGSKREIRMSEPVFQALQDQHKKTAELSEYVFCTATGGPLSNKNVSERVWYPLLSHLQLARRVPYQTRHTFATLSLAAGENPEWIARQMGQSTTEMLFKVYSRYVNDLTRKDGSALDRLISQNTIDKEIENDDGK